MSNEIISRLTTVFSVKDIMTPVQQLKRADTIENARYLFHEYDIVPYPRHNLIEGFFRRNSDGVNPIEPAYLVSEGTSLFEMPELFMRNSFYFVLSANTIIGYVHYSDLNKSIMKIPFFALFQLTERALWEKFKDRITEDNMKIVFGEDQVELFTTKRKEATKSNVDVGWTGVFTFPSILKLARHFGLIHFTDDEIRLLKDVRNNVSHSDRNLVAQYSDVETLVRAYSMFQQLLERA